VSEQAAEQEWDEGVKRVLVITAHPDDVDFGAAGSVAVWTSRGIDVTYCIVTDGDAGGFDPSVPRDKIGGIRQAEQRAAADAVGVSDVRFLGYPDGRVEFTLELRRDISRVIRQVRPQRVVTQPPERNYQRIYASHPDHLATGEAALCAVYPDARNPYAHPELAEEGHEAWTVPEVWIMGAGDEPDRWVETTDVIDRKVKALLSHNSQFTDPDSIETLIRNWGTGQAKTLGLPDGSTAEAFRRIATG
jgi:LmbE family N-acetylglucosaminyl deacetylase